LLRGPGGGAKVFVDQLASALGVRGIVDPHLGKGCLDGKLAREARGVRVEDARANAPFGEMVGEELRLGQVGRRVDALQNWYDTNRLTPSSRMPERLSAAL
jgi:hypothetical protein